MNTENPKSQKMSDEARKEFEQVKTLPPFTQEEIDDLRKNGVPLTKVIAELETLARSSS